MRHLKADPTPKNEKAVAALAVKGICSRLVMFQESIWFGYLWSERADMNTDVSRDFAF